MTEFPDARVRFYLEHEDLIDTWAALQLDTRSALTRWLGELRGDVDDLAQELGAESSFFEAGKWTNHRLARPAWNAATAEDLPVAVVMEWDSSKIKLPAVPPYVGLRVTGSAEVGGPRRAEFLARFSGSIKKTSEQYKLGNPTTWWPAHRPVPPLVLPWWEHLDEYREELLAGFGTAWNDLSPMVDDWLQGQSPHK